MKMINNFNMSLLESDEVKINLLKALLKNNRELSLNGLRKRIGAVNYTSVKRNCEFLEKFGLIKVEQKIIENKKYNFITITDKGKETLDYIKNSKSNLN